MKEITQIRSLSLWIFLVPLIAINTCLLISVNFTLFENTFFSVDQIGRSGFTIPYLDGSLSISRASRTFPQYLIFKPGMAITAILLCFYWYKNNLLINHFKNTELKKNSFMIFGILSAVFLLIHSILLGLETDIRSFSRGEHSVLVLKQITNSAQILFCVSHRLLSSFLCILFQKVLWIIVTVTVTDAVLAF